MRPPGISLPRRASYGSTSARYWSDRNKSSASQSSSIFSSASAAAMVESGTTQAPARRPPMKVSRYSIELPARMAILSPLPMPMAASVRAILLMRRSNSRQVRLLPSHTTARLSGHWLAWRPMRIGIETKSGKSSSDGCGTSSLSGSASGGLIALPLRLDLRDGPTGLLPGAETALEMGDRQQAHVLRRLGRQRRAPGAGAEEDELVAGLEVVLGVGALRIDPHLEHAARDVDRARDAAVAPQLARIADVDEGDARLTDQLDRIVNQDRLDLGVRLVDHLLHGLLHLERHRCPPDPMRVFVTKSACS